MIIFLNGCSSSGKSSIARSLQYLSEQPLLHLGIDTFFQMMPPNYLGYGEKANQGFHFITSVEAGIPFTRVVNGPFGEALIKSIPPIAQLLVKGGHNLILDEVLFGEDMLRKYVFNLRDEKVYFIGVYCALEELCEREMLRGNRTLGLGRDQFEKVHCDPRNYDLIVDTTNISSFSCAKIILNFVEQTPDPVGFQVLNEYFFGKENSTSP